MPVRATVEEMPLRPRGGKKWAIVGCVGCLVTPILVLAGYLAWASYLPPPEKETVVLPSPNGFDATVAASRKLTAVRGNSPIADPHNADPAALRQALAPDRPALDELRQAIRLDYVTPSVRSADALFPYLSQYRNAARMFAAEARVAAADGKPGEAIQRSLDAVELGSRLGRGAPVLHHLVAVAVSAIGVAGAERNVSALSAAETRVAGRRLDRILAQFPGLADALQEERKWGLAALREVATGKVPFDVSLTGEPASLQEKAMGLALQYFYPKSWAHSAMNDYLNATIAEAKRPFPLRKPVPLPTDPYVQGLAMEFGLVGTVFAKNDAQLRLLRLELALQEYRQRHGRFPPTLAQLSPEVMEAMPLDPFTEKPLVYRPRGRGYVLYSVGPDGVDNGGTPISPGSMGPTAAGDLVAGRLFQRRRAPAPAPQPRSGTR